MGKRRPLLIEREMEGEFAFAFARRDFEVDEGSGDARGLRADLRSVAIAGLQSCGIGSCDRREIRAD